MVATAPGHNQSVIRRRVVIPEDPNYCTVNLIDEGTIINGSDVTVHFRGVGPVREFLCLMDRQIQVLCEFVASKIKINSYGDLLSIMLKACTLYFTDVLLYTVFPRLTVNFMSHYIRMQVTLQLTFLVWNRETIT